MATSAILTCAALVCFCVEIMKSRGQNFIAWGLALLTAAQLFYGK